MSTAVDAPLAQRAREWNAPREAVRAALFLGMREIRNVLRQPESWIPSIIMPLFFYFVQRASLSGLAQGAGVENYPGFVLPVSILFATSNEGAGFNMVADLERGYFDKLLLSPAHRLSILVGALGANYLRVIVQAAAVTAVALALGLHFETGLVGAAGMIFLASVWGLAFGAVGVGVAMKTGSAQAVQGAQVVLFPLMFLTTSFAPKPFLSGWMQHAVTFNPVTYVLEGMRGFSQTGDMGEVVKGLISIAVIGTLTTSFALWALRTRLR
jgi:ABC-2 type transport system permease protein